MNLLIYYGNNMVIYISKLIIIIINNGNYGSVWCLSLLCLALAAHECIFDRVR